MSRSEPLLHLVGRPRWSPDGDALTTRALPCDRRTQLLVLLALRGDWVARSELAALLWPALERSRALANLRKTLHQARTLAGGETLEVGAEAVRWRVATDLNTPDGPPARGRLLDGFDDRANEAWTAWLDAERAAFEREARRRDHQRLAEAAADPAECERLARALLADDPFDEDAVVALLEAQRALQRFEAQRETYRAYALRLEEELGVAPSQRVAAAMRAPSAAAAAGFVGRDRELGALAALLAREECRLLTVVGPGGAGKSTLVKHALRRLGASFADGTFWLALDDLADVGQALARLVAELELVPGPQHDALQLVGERLRPLAALLVLDNAEHIDGIARFVERLLDAAPRLKVCATSRARLGAAHERLLPLPGLALPPPQASHEELLACDAARLFVGAASAAQPDFDARAQAGAIAELLRGVGALPLAILLAAPWVRLLPVAEIAAELARSIDMLDSGETEGDERVEHGSMQATIERSWQLLATREQQTLAALSVCVGSFSREAAREIAGASLPLLAALADKSLLQLLAGGRCALHPLIRQFARGKLDAASLALAERRHAEHYERLLAASAAAAELADQDALDAIAADLENCRQAWRWAVANRASGMIAATAPVLRQYFSVRGRAAEGLALLEAGRRACDESAAAAAVLLAAIAQLQYRLSLLDAAIATARLGLRRARESGHRAALVRCLSVLGTSLYQLGHNVEARRVLQQALRRALADADRRGAALAQHNLALVEKALGNHARAAGLLREWLVAQREAGDWLRVAMGLSNLAYIHQAQGEWQLAQACLDEGLAICDEHDLQMPRPPMLANLAHNHAAAGRLDDADRIAGALVDEARAKRLVDVEATALNQRVRVALLRGDLAAARARLGEAAARASTTSIEYIRMECVFSYARLLAAEGRARAAAPLLRHLLARRDLEPVDRREAEACLKRLGRQGRAAATPDAGLDVLVERIVAELAAHAAGT